MSPTKINSPTTMRVLVVDDEGSVRTLIRTILAHSGFQAFESSSGEEAVRLYQERHAEIDLVLLDVQMKGMDGPQTLDALRQINPNVRCCFLTGDAGRYTEEDLLRRGALRVLHKPFVLAAVQELLTGESQPSILGTGTETSPSGETRSTRHEDGEHREQP